MRIRIIKSPPSGSGRTSKLFEPALAWLIPAVNIYIYRTGRILL